jgi:hypothetical protein
MAPSDDISDYHGGVSQVVIPSSIDYHSHCARASKKVYELAAFGDIG